MTNPNGRSRDGPLKAHVPLHLSKGGPLIPSKGGGEAAPDRNKPKPSARARAPSHDAERAMAPKRDEDLHRDRRPTHASPRRGLAAPRRPLNKMRCVSRGAVGRTASCQAALALHCNDEDDK